MVVSSQFMASYLAEHGDHGVQHDVGLSEVRGRALDQDIRCLQPDAAEVAVDDRGQREDVPVGTPDHGVYLHTECTRMSSPARGVYRTLLSFHFHKNSILQLSLHHHLIY